MQVVTCGSQIGWRKQSRKLIIVSTDEDFHMAGDGLLGGIIESNDERCRLNPEGRTTIIVYLV